MDRSPRLDTPPVVTDNPPAQLDPESEWKVSKKLLLIWSRTYLESVPGGAKHFPFPPRLLRSTFIIDVIEEKERILRRNNHLYRCPSTEWGTEAARNCQPMQGTLGR
jgi:hypothetical protein